MAAIRSANLPDYIYSTTMNAAAAFRRAGIVKAGDFIANGFRFFGIGHVYLAAITR
jgi:hypothetical protein